MSTNHPTFDPLESTLSRRLRGLGAHAPDASALQRRFDAVLDDDATVHPPHPHRRTMMFGAMAATAALLIAFALTSPRDDGALLATPNQLSQFHARVTDGYLNVASTRNLDTLRELLRTEGLPTSGAGFPAPIAHASCLSTLNNHTIAGVLVDHGGQAVTVIVASDPEAVVALPPGQPLIHDGAAYTLATRSNTRIVAGRVHDKIVCVVGTLPTPELVTLLATLAE